MGSACVAEFFNFNSHAHVERDPIAYLKKSLSINFNSHAHVERDLWNTQTAEVKLEISTHTLTWSVTLYIYHSCKDTLFQLTRSRGA